MRRTTTGTVAIVLSALAVLGWLLSYSWLLGAVLPEDVVTAVLPEERLERLGVSPWLVAEVVAIPTGAAGAVLGSVARGTLGDVRRRLLLAAVVAGVLVAVLSLLSLATMP